MTTTGTGAGTTTSAVNEARTPHAGGTTQVYVLYIKAPADRVWDAITEPEQIARFFHGAQVEGTYEVGGRRRSWSPDRSVLWGDNEILEWDPPHRMVHTWRSLYDDEMAAEPESRVTWEVEPAGDDCTKLTLVHDRLEASPKTAANVVGWSWILSNLKTLLETGRPLTSA